LHIAFSPERAGTYLDYTIPEPGSTWSPSNPDGTPGSPQTLIYEPELYQSAIKDQGKVIKNKDALYMALIEFAGFKPETAAIFMCIPERESKFRSGGFNGKTDTGDYSFGIWQINVYDDDGKGNSKYLDKTIDVPTLVNGKIVKKRKKLLHLVFKDHVSLGIKTKEQATALMETIYKTEGIGGGIKYADPALFSAAVQVQFLKLITDSYAGKDWKFMPWGEYSIYGSKYGWITELNFKTAVGYYIRNNPGKTEEDLKKHCAPFIDDMKKHSPEGVKVYNRWLNGEVFPFSAKPKK
jgi:hypothetical protein